MEFVELTKEEFFKIQNKLENANFYQTTAWADIKKSNGWDAAYVGVKNSDGKIIGASLILKKKLIVGFYMGYAPRGFLIDFKDKKVLDFFTKEIKQYAKNNHYIFIKIDPYYIYQERDKDGNIIENENNNKELVEYLKNIGYKHHGINDNIFSDLQPRFMSVLDIDNKTYEDLYKDMRKGTKKVLRRSHDGTLSIKEVEKKEDLKVFKELTTHTSSRRGFIDRPLSYYETLYDALNKDGMIKIILGEIHFDALLEKVKRRLKELDRESNDYEEFKNKYEEQIKELEQDIKDNGKSLVVSAILFVLYNKEATALVGASIDKYMKYNAHYFIHDYMLHYTTDEKYETYNFYGIDANFDPKSKDYGLFYFKRGFNADVKELIGEFDLVINKFMYNLYTLAFKSYKKLKNIKNHIKQ